MRHDQVRTALMLAMLVLAGSGAHAQNFAYGALGVTVPTGDFGDYAKTGWIGTVGVGTAVGKRGAWGEAELLYGSNGHDNATGGRSSIVGVMVALGHTFNPSSTLTPYVLGAIGFLSHNFHMDAGPDARVKLALSPGGGVSYVVSKKAKVYLETRYVLSSGTGFIPLLAGVSINFGK